MVRRPHKLKIAESPCNQVNTGSELWQANKCGRPHNAAPSEQSCRGMNYGKLTDVVSTHHSKAAPSGECIEENELKEVFVCRHTEYAGPCAD